MAATKYGQYIKSGLLKDITQHYIGHSLLAHEGELGVNCSIGYHCIAKPISFDSPHAHEFAELLCFIGGNPLDITDLGADIEVCLGEEQEKHRIKGATVVAIPGGLVHCPISIKNVIKPMVFLEISLSGKYSSSKKSDGGSRLKKRKLV